MKVLHISTSDFGGAGLCALRICRSLRNVGIDSEMLVARKSSDESFVNLAKESGRNCYVPPQNKVLSKMKQVLRRRGYCLTSLEKYQQSADSLKNKVFYTFPISKYDLASHPLVKEADIIHLHWVSNFIDYPTFFANVDKPIVWTLHDENIGYGGFHYTRSREEFYSLCKPLEDELLGIKQNSLSIEGNNIYLVAISEVMQSFCAKVPFLQKYPITLIHNGIDANIFSPVDKGLAKRVFGIPKGHIVFSFCAQSLQDPRKGLKELIRALELVGVGNITLICAGDEELPMKSKLINIIRVGVVNNERLLSVFYSCSDCFVLSSFEESFGQTPLEAMACGVPVVAFPCGVTKELITEANGVRCEDFTVESLADGIKIALGRDYDGEAIRKDVISRFSYERIGKDYLELYSGILDK